MPSLVKASECVADTVGIDRLRVKLAKADGAHNATGALTKKLELEVRVDLYGYKEVGGILRKFRSNLDASLSQGILVQCFTESDITVQAIFTKSLMPVHSDVSISGEGAVDACPAYSEWELIRGVGSCSCSFGFDGSVTTSIRKQTLTYLHVGSCSRVLADEIALNETSGTCEGLGDDVMRVGSYCGCPKGSSASLHYDTASGAVRHFCRSSDQARSPIKLATFDKVFKDQYTSVDVVAKNTPVRITTRDNINVVVES
jgi:hypothetical protein